MAYIIKTAEFVISAVSPKQYPNTPLPEVAFVGRSNVGKSSLLNTLVGQKKLAKTSGTPGKTRQINFFQINSNCHFVDLPGYGYAKVSKTEREQWRRMIEEYLTDRSQLRLIVSLIDIRHEPTSLDKDLLKWLEAIERDYIVVLTKHDKISVKQADECVAEVRGTIGASVYCKAVIPFSSQTRYNKELLLNTVNDYISA